MQGVNARVGISCGLDSPPSGRTTAASAAGVSAPNQQTPRRQTTLCLVGRDSRGKRWATSPTFPVSTVPSNSFSATGAGLTCGYEVGPAVGDDYEAPFRCTATIHTAIVTLSEHVPVNPLVEFERIMSEQ